MLRSVQAFRLRSLPFAAQRRLQSTATGSPLQVEDRDAVRWITLNRPGSLNALTASDLDAFIHAVEEAPVAVRAIAVRGEGRAFCAGMNTRQFEGLNRDDARKLIGKVGHAVGSLRLSPRPTAVLMHGYCIGAAFEMALAADFRVACPDTQVGLPETRVGIPSVVDAALLQHHVGLSLAKEMLLTGELVDITRLGPNIVNAHAKDAEDLITVAEKLLAKVTDLTPVVMAAQKTLNEAWVNLPLQHAIEFSMDIFADVSVHPQTHEAVRKYNSRNKKK